VNATNINQTGLASLISHAIRAANRMAWLRRQTEARKINVTLTFAP
jgi:hypothetical protein